MNRQSGFTVTVLSIVGGIYLVALLCGLLVNITTAHPQLQFGDQQKVSGNELLARLLRKYETHPQRLKQLRQQIYSKPKHQQQPDASYAHNFDKYQQPMSSASSSYGGSGSFGEGIGSSNTYGGYGHQSLEGASSGYGATGGGGASGHGYQPVGPVFTFVRTDHHGNFQWGVRHKIAGGWGR